ncbi:hypothetical protein LX76_04600, partial [Cereibacter changlensis]
IDAGYLALKDGSLSLDAFKVELAKVWAGFPLPSGKSYYAGVAGNKATISYRNYSAYMAQIFPVEARKGPAAVRVAANPWKGLSGPLRAILGRLRGDPPCPVPGIG